MSAADLTRNLRKVAGSLRRQMNIEQNYARKNLLHDNAEVLEEAARYIEGLHDEIAGVRVKVEDLQDALRAQKLISGG